MPGNNSYWFEEQRAKGIYYICKLPMNNSDPKQAHTLCRKLQSEGKKYKEIQEIVRKVSVDK